MKVYAHRGCSGFYPENTMLAFREAARTGCYGIELDVQLSKDGEVVIIHDETLDRVTDGTGLVRDYTLEELKKFNAANLWLGTYEPQQIPTFEEYCQWVKDTDLVTNIEIKSGVYYYEGLEQKTLDLVRKYGLEDRVVVSSFNHLSIVLMKKLAPEIKVGALVEHQGLGNAGYYCDTHGFECYHPGIKGLDKETVDGCNARGIEVNVWTVNEMGDLERIYDWGCNAAITNYPGVAKAWLDLRARDEGKQE